MLNHQSKIMVNLVTVLVSSSQILAKFERKFKLRLTELLARKKE